MADAEYRESLDRGVKSEGQITTFKDPFKGSSDRSMIDGKLKNVDERLDFLSNQLGQLFDIIAPVLRPKYVNPSDESGQDRPEQSPMADYLDGYSQRISSMASEVAGIIDRVEL